MSKKVSICASERNDSPGISPLFDHKTSEIIGTLSHGKITYFDKSRRDRRVTSSSKPPYIDSLMNETDFPTPLAASSNSKVNRLTRERSLTELMGGPL